MKSVAGTLRLGLAQFRELEAFMQFAQDLDKTTADRIESGRRMVEVLKQRNGAPIPVEKQVAVLYASDQKFFADVSIAKVSEVEKLLIEFLDGQHSKELAEIKNTGVVSDKLKTALNRALEEFKLAHRELFSSQPVAGSK